MAYLTFKKVRSASEADESAIQTTLFRGDTGWVCGWFLGPLTFTDDGAHVPYLAQADQTLASVAIMRAVEAAKLAKSRVCIIDPDDLWDPAWAH